MSVPLIQLDLYKNNEKLLGDVRHLDTDLLSQYKYTPTEEAEFRCSAAGQDTSTKLVLLGKCSVIKVKRQNYFLFSLYLSHVYFFKS